MSQVPDFASGYSRSHRIYELAGITLGLASIVNLGVHLALADKVSGWWVPLTVFVGLLGADFISGFVHWLFDTWGSVDTPVVGQLAIRTFREHHVDERAMTRHDFVETNGHNIGLATLPAVVGYLALRDHTLFHALVAMAAFSMACCVAMTSQIHKWSHLDNLGGLVGLLQNWGLIINARHHDRHHVWPHDSHYCITVGWMNAPLELVGFFRILERGITAVTGAKPREEDLVATVAANPEVLTQLPPPPEPGAEAPLTPKVAGSVDAR
jgi:ubiquitin-conjugating enzyme E2 variant